VVFLLREAENLESALILVALQKRLRDAIATLAEEDAKRLSQSEEGVPTCEHRPTKACSQIARWTGPADSRTSSKSFNRLSWLRFKGSSLTTNSTGGAST
jgi:hypothetical protein